MSLSAAVGAPSPVQIGDRTYQASPVNLFQLGEMEEFIRARLINRAAKATIGLPRATGDQLMDRALAKSEEITFDSDESRSFLRTLPGMSFLVSISLRANHPDMTPEKVCAAMESSPQQRADAIATVIRISGFGSKDGDATSGGSTAPGEAQPGA